MKKSELIHLLNSIEGDPDVYARLSYTIPDICEAEIVRHIIDDDGDIILLDNCSWEYLQK